MKTDFVAITSHELRTPLTASAASWTCSAAATRELSADGDATEYLTIVLTCRRTG